MICQYCGSALNTGGTCLNPACPGRLRREEVKEAVRVPRIKCMYCGKPLTVVRAGDATEGGKVSYFVDVCPCRKATLAPVAPVSKMVRIDQGLPTNYCSFCGHSYEDDGMKCYMGPDVSICSDCLDALNGQLVPLDDPAPAEVERLVDDLLSVSKQLGQSEARGLYDHIEPAEVAINDLKSRLLAALTNTPPYLSRDVNVPVVELKDAAHRLAMYVLQSEAYQRDMDTRDAVDGVLALVMPKKAGE